MRNFTHKFKAVTFFLKRIIRCRGTFYNNFCCLDLKWLLCLWCCDKCSFYNDCRTNIQLGNFAKVLHIIMIYYLKVFKERSIIYNDKSKCLRITDTAHPSPDGHFFIQIFLSVSV